MSVDGVSPGPGHPNPGPETPGGNRGPSAPPPKPKAEARTQSPPHPDRPVTTRPHFSVDPTDDQVSIVVVDEETGKVVRRVPPEQMMALAQHPVRGLGVLLETHG